jgi:hypothetical protein
MLNLDLTKIKEKINIA